MDKGDGDGDFCHEVLVENVSVRCHHGRHGRCRSENSLQKKKNPSVELDCSEAALEHKGSAGWMCQMSTVGAQELIFLPAAAVEIVSWSIAAM